MTKTFTWLDGKPRELEIHKITCQSALVDGQMGPNKVGTAAHLLDVSRVIKPEKPKQPKSPPIPEASGLHANIPLDFDPEDWQKGDDYFCPADGCDWNGETARGLRMHVTTKRKKGE